MKILVVEDDALVGWTIDRQLTRAGYDVSVAGCGSDALDMSLGCAPDLVVLDLTLPDMAGRDVLRGLRALDPDLPVLILSGALPAAEMLDRFGIGAYAVLTKPFRGVELVARIRGILPRPGDGPDDGPEAVMRLGDRA